MTGLEYNIDVPRLMTEREAVNEIVSELHKLNDNLSQLVEILGGKENGFQ